MRAAMKDAVINSALEKRRRSYGLYEGCGVGVQFTPKASQAERAVAQRQKDGDVVTVPVEFATWLEDKTAIPLRIV